eukprot:scaffold84861_cov34-Prasinocladus_malaysianus.AAC.1
MSAASCNSVGSSSSSIRESSALLSGGAIATDISSSMLAQPVGYRRSHCFIFATPSSDRSISAYTCRFSLDCVQTIRMDLSAFSAANDIRYACIGYSISWTCYCIMTEALTTSDRVVPLGNWRNTQAVAPRWSSRSPTALQ